jgi:ectoine hydroxylase-related dioxygenase (phytanoyl-CoA dioxygenase family)
LFAHPQAVPLELEAGDVLFHAVSTPHGSRPNRSDRIRRTLYIHFINEQARQTAYGTAATAWAASKPVWGAEREAFIRKAQAERRSRGWATDAPTLRLAEDGLRAQGVPLTPSGHWAELAAALTPAQATALRNLNRAAAAR